MVWSHKPCLENGVCLRIRLFALLGVAGGMVGNSKMWLLFVVSPILSFALSSALMGWVQKPPVKSVARSGRDVEEYAVYSAFINQKYIQPDSRRGFNVRGTIIEGFGPDRIEEVVILPQTLATLDYYIPRTKLKSMLPPVAQPAFSDYLASNDQSYPLVAHFDLKVPYSFFSKEDGNTESPVVNQSKARLGHFVARHPNALGYLSLSRVGFSTDHNVAVVGFAQTDFSVHSNSTRMWGGLASLRKEGGNWRFQDVYLNDPEQKPLTIELARCGLDSRNLYWGLGSATVSVKGRRGSACLIEQTSELEGGYIQSECRIPISIGTLTIYGGNTDFYYSLNVSKNCKAIGSGNLMWKNQSPKNRLH